MPNKIIPYNPKLKELAKQLRKQGILSEVILWKKIKNKALGVQFHRQVPLDNYIVDFFCHELMLAIEIDGNSHNFEEVELNDIKRQHKLESLGVQFIRFEDKAVKQNINFVLHALMNKIEGLQEYTIVAYVNIPRPSGTPLVRGNCDSFPL
jgi:very-short-patch-repair endonuclease